ncbi:hypothetical protein [Flavobacterium sp. SM2513]|uniref:hypothetical protein n=1 Tax=Flavobacterium sp. SM2513 TaxID=3424766 RepID=UPI003D7FED6E
MNEKLQGKTFGVNGTYKEYIQFKRKTYREGCGESVSKPLNFRLVHELKAIQSSFNSFVYSELSMNFRMSYDAGNGWADANSTERQAVKQPFLLLFRNKIQLPYLYKSVLSYADF